MAYDMHGVWDDYIGHPSQLYAHPSDPLGDMVTGHNFVEVWLKGTELKLFSNNGKVILYLTLNRRSKPVQTGHWDTNLRSEFYFLFIIE